MRTIHNLTRSKITRKNLRNSPTVHEVILWSRIKNKQLGYKFRRQQGIGLYVVDFYCPKKKLIIEIDGKQHGEEKQKKYDIERTKYLENLGFKILRIWNNEINKNLKGVMETILFYLK